MHARRVVERAETIDGILSGRELGVWVGNMLDVVDVSLHPLYMRTFG